MLKRLSGFWVSTWWMTLVSTCNTGVARQAGMVEAVRPTAVEGSFLAKSAVLRGLRAVFATAVTNVVASCFQNRAPLAQIPRSGVNSSYWPCVCVYVSSISYFALAG